MKRIVKSTTIMRPLHDVYEFWRDLENLPRFMIHLEMVEVTGGKRSHWVARAPAGRTVEWDAELIDDIPDKKISWRSLEGSDVMNAGSVQFKRAPGDRGTEVFVELSYDAPAGSAGAAIAKAFNEEPGQQVLDDLRRFKQVMETGEVVRSDGAPEGAGMGPTKQRAAQPAAETTGPEARP